MRVAPARLSPADLYRLRRAHLVAERRALEARLAANAARWLLLRLEASYRLLGREATVNIQTGVIALGQQAPPSAPANPATAPANPDRIGAPPGRSSDSFP